MNLSLRCSGAAFVVWLLAAPAHAEDPNPYLSGGIQAFDNFEYDKALEILGRALQQPDTATADKAQVYLYLGLVHFTLGDKPSAEKEFGEALGLDCKAELPADTSPKIVASFDELKNKFPCPVEAPPPVVAPRKRLWTWVVAGIGGAALAAGGTFGFLAADAKKAFDQEQWADKALALKDSVETRALAANILFGVGGATMIAAVVLFFTELSLGSPAAEGSAVSLSPTIGGVQATVRF